MMADAATRSAQDAFWRATEKLLFHHTNPWELDEALVAWGFAMGPCEAQDLLGLDKVLRRQNAPVTPVLSRMVAEGRMGKIGGVGFYRYPGRGGAVIDPLIEDLIREEAWFAKLERVERDDDALVAALLKTLSAVAHDLHQGGASMDIIEATFATGLHFPADEIGVLWDLAQTP
jgi:3-hydroxyacyl-CoA dehydrogenase